MIDPIGVKPGTVQGGRVEYNEPTKVVPLQSVSAPQQAVVAETGARETVKAMAVRPPVDSDRVQQIKKALQEGRYPILPTKIADNIIAAQFLWVEQNDAK
ncbi:MAG: flagellar biosynthesis anti-sigma factor FlgM [Proteobacteria bacterium]|nr:flagellar biosynthesis anti-sigma factor FlgM [Pseudomonadota bacterium]